MSGSEAISLCDFEAKPKSKTFFNAYRHHEMELMGELISIESVWVVLLHQADLTEREMAARFLRCLSEIAQKKEIEGDEFCKYITVESGYSIIKEMMAKLGGEGASGLSNAHGRSRIDASATAGRMHLRKRLLPLLGDLIRTTSHFRKSAEKYAATLLPYRDYSLPAVTGRIAGAALEFYLYVSILLERAIKAAFCSLESIMECPLGTGARTGTLHYVDLKLAAELLGFKAVAEPSLMGRDVSHLQGVAHVFSQLG